MLQFVGWTSQDNSQKNSATNATMQITDNQKRAFIAQILPIAQAEQQKYKIFASITLAQAALESDWGSKPAC